MSLAWILALALQGTIDYRPLDRAVQKGVQFLKSRASEILKEKSPPLRELALWVLAQTAVAASDPVLNELLNDVLAHPPETTVSAALQAVALQALDEARYRSRIHHCAQFLVDNQAADGLWGPGESVDAPVPLPPPPPPPAPPVRSFELPRKRPVLPKVELRRRREGPKEGDLINARWAAWGLLASHQCGLLPPRETSLRAAETWLGDACDPAAAVSCLSIYRYLLGKDWKKDAGALKALDRLAATERPTDPRLLFDLRRAMFHFDSAKLGGREWFPEGMNALLGTQNPEGGWGGIEETCWAVLYLYVVRAPPMIDPDRK
jgi:hypothetical protein